MSNFKFVKLQNFAKTTKMPKFVTKNVLFWCFSARILKNYRHIWNQHPQIPQHAKFCEITKIPKFLTKYALFGYFVGRILKSCCQIWKRSVKFAKLENFTKKQKCLNLGPKMSNWGILAWEFWKATIIF